MVPDSSLQAGRQASVLGGTTHDRGGCSRSVPFAGVPPALAEGPGPRFPEPSLAAFQSRQGARRTESCCCIRVNASPMAVEAPGLAFGWIDNELRTSCPSPTGLDWPPGLAVAGETGHGGRSETERWDEPGRGRWANGWTDRNGRARIGRIPTRVLWVPRRDLGPRAWPVRKPPGALVLCSPESVDGTDGCFAHGWIGHRRRARLECDCRNTIAGEHRGSAVPDGRPDLRVDGSLRRERP